MAGSRGSCGWRCPYSETSKVWEAIPEIAGAAMIREVHVYGPALAHRRGERRRGATSRPGPPFDR